MKINHALISEFGNFVITFIQINSLLKMIFPPFLGELFCGGKN